jgi:hypothetical protein
VGDATEFSVSLTSFEDKTFFDLKRAMDENREVKEMG